MQSLRKVASQVAGQTRGMSTTAAEAWSPYFPKAPAPVGDAHKRALRKEVLGFMLLGPVSAALMVYDLIFGLEHHDAPPSPPYPWMRLRTFPDMPWGPDGLFESTRTVYAEWPPAEGIPEKGHH